MPDDALSRALLLTRNFPPLVGGMEQLNRRVFAALETRYQVGLVGPRGCSAHVPATTCTIEVAHQSLPKFLAGALAAAVRAARSLRPGLVVAGSGLLAPHARLVARIGSAPYAVYVHGLDIVVRHPVYRLGWLPAIRAADRVVANSRHTANLAIAAGVSADRIRIVSPGAEPIPMRAVDCGRWRAASGIGDGPLLLSVGRLTTRKGLPAFIRDVMPRLVERFPNLTLAIVGNEARDALKAAAGSERERILEATRAAGVMAHVRLLGGLSDEALGQAFGCADLHVFPVLELPGDVEGFGMVALEAAAHGVPTVGYAVGGVPDAVEQGVSGELVAAGDAPALGDAITRWLSGSRDTREACRAFVERNSWTEFNRKLLAALP